jgi:hypothetical protein
MLDDRFEREVVDAPPDPRRYPTGVLMLAGILAGAVGGLLIDLVPLGTAIGMAIGAGLDVALNRWLNGEHGM